MQLLPLSELYMFFRSLARVCTIAIFAISFSACAANNDNQSNFPTAPADQNFITGATQSSNAEISAGTIALQKSTNADVRAYAQEMITQHTQQEQQLAPIAQSAGATVPPPTSLNATQQQVAATLQATPEPAFDGVYINSQITAHQLTISNVFTPEVASGVSGTFKNFARATLPQLQQHLEMAQSIAAKYGY